MSDVIWISWENHRRTNEICDYLSIKPYVIISSRSSLFRYFYLLKETLNKIVKVKPSTLIVQNPSIVLASIAVLLQPLFKYQLIVDAHNEAVQPYAHNSWVIKTVARLLMRYSKYTIVTNKYLAKIVSVNGGRPIILPDRIPNIRRAGSIRLAQNTYNIILVATYAADEPITQIIDAASMLEGGVTLYVTGNYSRLDKLYIDSLSSNIIFTGFLTNEDYWSYLNSAHAVVDLSLKDNCLVCGAYEGLAVGKPMILSNNKATVQYFSKGVVYTDNSSLDIHRAFQVLIKNHASLSVEIVALRNELAEGWQNIAERLREVVN